MNKYLVYFLILISGSGCSVVSKQYYYVPTTSHLTIKGRGSYIGSKVDITDCAGKNIGSITTGNGMGIPLFLGPPYLPVVPVAIVSVFSKKLRQFEIDIAVNADEGYFMALAVDSNNYKKVNDSLAAIKVGTAVDLQTSSCYMIVNGSTKIPLRVRGYFMGQTHSHNYRMYATVAFGKVRTMTIVTGNPLLDNRLKSLVFKRKKRLSFFVFGLS